MTKTGMSSNTMILIVATFITAFGNSTLVTNVLKTYPLTGENLPALLSLIAFFGGATVLLLAPLCFKNTTKPVLIIILFFSAAAAYFMDSYGIVISDDMLRNIAHTNTAEALELLTPKLLIYIVLLAMVPALAIVQIPLRWNGFKNELVSRLKLIGITLSLVTATVLIFGSFYASFFREHKELRAHANPSYYIYSLIKYATHSVESNANVTITTIGEDAMIPVTDIDRELIIMVVGETARADRFSLNGYPRDTNPRLKEKNIINFSNFWACGTSTAVSVPCMFLLNGEPKGPSTIRTEENLLDVLQRSGVNVIWLDNNSDSKGVAARTQFLDYKSPQVNPVCDVECRDEGMLTALQTYIDSHSKGDILVVLHQMGNHGPAYYRRYPPQFEKFKPACKSNDLNQCSREEIGNAYDNALLYTDHFLAKAINLLEANNSKFETALFYVSDHGESLGENGLYLHGLPKAIAPDTQLHIPALMWFGSNFRDVNLNDLRMKSGKRYSHSNVFHTMLGLFEIESSVYIADMDLLNGARRLNTVK